MHLQLIVPALCVGVPPGTLRVPLDNLGFCEALGEWGGAEDQYVQEDCREYCATFLKAQKPVWELACLR